MKRLLLSSLLCCILVAEISAGYREVIGGALFSTVCAGLGYAAAKHVLPALPARHTPVARLVGVASGVVSGLACLVAARLATERPKFTHEGDRRHSLFVDLFKGHIAGAVALTAASAAQAVWHYAPDAPALQAMASNAWNWAQRNAVGGV